MQGLFDSHHNFDTPGTIYSGNAGFTFPMTWTDIPFVAFMDRMLGTGIAEEPA